MSMQSLRNRISKLESDLSDKVLSDVPASQLPGRLLSIGAVVEVLYQEYGVDRISKLSIDSGDVGFTLDGRHDFRIQAGSAMAWVRFDVYICGHLIVEEIVDRHYKNTKPSKAIYDKLETHFNVKSYPRQIGTV